VLVVDDDEDNLEALVLYLEAAGLTVQGAASAADALKQLRAGFRPCVVVVDLVMPDMDGWMLVEALRADRRLASLRVLLHSGGDEDPDRARRLGVRACFLKPVEPHTITDAIAEHCPASSPRQGR